MTESDFYDEDSYASTYDSIAEYRDDAMDSLTDAEVSTVGLVSDEIDELIDPLSDYMQQAKADSRKRGEEAGMLESGFLEGVGETEAIDSVYGVAQGNIYNDSFNANASNIEELDRYKADFQSAYIEQIGQTADELAQWDFGLEQQSEATEQQYQNYYSDLEHQYSLDLTEQQAKNVIDYNKILYDYLSEDSKIKDGYAKTLQDMKIAFDNKLSEMKSTYERESTADSVARYWEDRAIYEWLDIQFRNMLPEEKAKAIKETYDLIRGYSPDSYIPTIDTSDRLYNWDDDDLEGWGDRLQKRFKDIQLAIEEQVPNGKARKKVDGYNNAKNIQIHWDRYVSDFPKASNKILKWFVTNGVDKLDEDNYTKVIAVTAFLMSEMRDDKFKALYRVGTPYSCSTTYADESAEDGSTLTRVCPIWDFDESSGSITKNGKPIDLMELDTLDGIQY